MWKDIFKSIWSDWKAHSLEELIIQVISIVFILIIGTIAIKLIGKKSIAQMTLPNVLFIFTLSSTLGALITKPQRILVALLVVVTIVAFIWLLEKLQMKFNIFEKMIISYPAILYQEGRYEVQTLKKEHVTVDQIESLIRQKGLPSVEACKTIILEPTGVISVEMKPEYEPIKKIYFDQAIKQILKAIDQNAEYVEAIPNIKHNLNEEVKKGYNEAQYNKILE